MVIFCEFEHTPNLSLNRRPLIRRLTSDSGVTIISDTARVQNRHLIQIYEVSHFALDEPELDVPVEFRNGRSSWSKGIYTNPTTTRKTFNEIAANSERSQQIQKDRRTSRGFFSKFRAACFRCGGAVIRARSSLVKATMHTRIPMKRSPKMRNDIVSASPCKQK